MQDSSGNLPAPGSATTSPSKPLPKCRTCNKIAAFRCTGCNFERYCSYECQKKHWLAGHRYECKPAPGGDGSTSGSISSGSLPSGKGGRASTAAAAPSSATQPGQQTQTQQPPPHGQNNQHAQLTPHPPPAPAPPASSRPTPLAAPRRFTSQLAHHGEGCAQPSESTQNHATTGAEQDGPMGGESSHRITGAVRQDGGAAGSMVEARSTSRGAADSCERPRMLASHPLLDVSVSVTSSISSDHGSPRCVTRPEPPSVLLPHLHPHPHPPPPPPPPPPPSSSAAAQPHPHQTQPPPAAARTQASLHPVTAAPRSQPTLPPSTLSPSDLPVRGHVLNTAATPTTTATAPHSVSSTQRNPPTSTRAPMQPTPPGQPPSAVTPSSGSSAGRDASLHPFVRRAVPGSTVSPRTAVAAPPSSLATPSQPSPPAQPSPAASATAVPLPPAAPPPTGTRASGSPLRRGFLGRSASPARTPVASSGQPSVGPPTPRPLVTTTSSPTAPSSSSSRDSSPLRRGFLNHLQPPPTTRASSRSILDNQHLPPPLIRQQHPSHPSPAAAASDEVVAPPGLGPLRRRSTSGGSAAQSSPHAASHSGGHSLGPVAVVPARAWGGVEGTHVGALNDDVLEEVFVRLPPRALAMAGMACRAWQRLALCDRLWAPLFWPVLGVAPPAWWRTRHATDGCLTLTAAPADQTQHSAALHGQASGAGRGGGGAATGMQNGYHHTHAQQQQQEAADGQQPTSRQPMSREPAPPEHAPTVVSGVRGTMALRQQQQQQQQQQQRVPSRTSSLSSSSTSRAERAASLASHPLEHPLPLSPLASPSTPAAPRFLPALPASALPRPPLYRVMGRELRLRSNWLQGRHATHSLRDHTGNVECAEILETAAFGNCLVTSGWDGAVLVYVLRPGLRDSVGLASMGFPSASPRAQSARGPRCVRKWTAHRGWITSMAAGRHYVVTVATDRKLSFYRYTDEVHSPECAIPLRDDATCVRFAYRGAACETMVLTGQMDGSLHLWDLQNRQLVLRYQGATDAIWRILPLPLAVLPLPCDSTPLEPCSNASWLYQASTHKPPTRSRPVHTSTLHAGAARASTAHAGSYSTAWGAAMGAAESNGHPASAHTFWGCSFVSTSRDGSACVWALPPLLRRRCNLGWAGERAGSSCWQRNHEKKGSCEGGDCGWSSGKEGAGGWGGRSPFSSTFDGGRGVVMGGVGDGRGGCDVHGSWEVHDGCADAEAAAEEEERVAALNGWWGGEVRPVREFRAYADTNAGASSSSVNGSSGGGRGNSDASASSSTSAARQPGAQGPPHLHAIHAAVPGPSASVRSHALRSGAGVAGVSVALQPPPTVPTTPLIQLSPPAGLPAILSSDVWVPAHGQPGEPEGVLAMIAAGSADGSLRVWTILGWPLGVDTHHVRAQDHHHHHHHHHQQQQQQQAECVVLAGHGHGVMSARFALMPIATSSSSSSSRSGSTDASDVAAPRERRLVLITGSMKEVKVWDVAGTGSCLACLDHLMNFVCTLSTFPDFLVTLAMNDGLLAYHCAGLPHPQDRPTATATSANSQPAQPSPFTAVLSMLAGHHGAALAACPAALAVGTGIGDVTLYDFGS